MTPILFIPNSKVVPHIISPRYKVAHKFHFVRRIVSVPQTTSFSYHKNEYFFILKESKMMIKQL
jgi:hypothetical protein